MVEDLKEIAPCGMPIHYTVDTETDFVTYTDINGRGEHRLCEACKGCSWKAICKPTACNYMEIITDGDGKTVMRVTKQPYRWEDENGGKREI